MTIVKKVVIIFVFSGLFLSCIATGYVAQREYQVALDKLVDGVTARVLDRPELQFYFYRQDESGLKHVLGDLLKFRAVSAAIAYSNLGEVLARLDLSSTTPGQLPSLKSLRKNLSVTETGLIAVDRGRMQYRPDFWSSLVASDSALYLTTPVFSNVNPVAKGLGLSEFADASIEPGENNSLVVIGYIQLAVDRSILLRDIRPAVGHVFLGSLILLLLCVILIYLITRRTLAPLSDLSQLAHQILAGENKNGRDDSSDGEFQDIAKVLHGVMEDSAQHKYEVGLENKLLMLKADERASQLSMREQELSKATEEISATREQLHRLANYDRLTALPNRQLFTEQLELLLRVCARSAKPLALLFINLNQFHRINESLGRSAGDFLLQEVGKRLVGCLRSSDVLAHYVNSDEGLNVSRLGGDEFAVVLSQLDGIDAAGLVAQRVIDRLVEPMTIQGHELVINPSIGIAVAPRNGMDAEDLLRSSCTAMHHAKLTSSSDFLFYSDDMLATGQDDLKMESELRKALERHQFCLHYQPQVDTTDGSIICAEALLRWEHAEFGLVSPARFIDLAEKMGLIWELGDWVLVEACRQMKVFKELGLELPRIAINISPQQFKPAFVTRLREVLQSANLSPSMLELGLSEVILMDNDSNVLKFLQELKDTGVYLSLENFGTNHAPISYLSRHPLDEIKIDRSFVLDCDKRKDAARLVKAIIAMAKSLNLRTVAEGVETEGEYQFLAGNGVSIMRGYLFSRPVPAADLQQLLVVPWHFMTQIQRMALVAELNSPLTT